MQILTLTFTEPLNASLQPGDFVYYSPLTTVANSGFSTVTTGSTILLGTVNSISNPLGNLTTPITINVLFDELNVTPPTNGDYILFEKDKRVNSSSLIGYYADVKFVNYSTEKIELFSVGSEISESSK